MKVSPIKYLLWSITFTLLFNTQLLGQPDFIDSLRTVIKTLPENKTKVNRLIILSEKLYYEGLLDEAKEKAEEALKLAITLGYKSGEARTYWKLSEQLLNEDVPKAKKYLQKSLKISLDLDHQRLITGTYNELGYFYLHYVVGQVDSSLYFFNRSLEINNGDYPRDQRYSYRFLSSYYSTKLDYETALEYNDKSIALDTTNLYAWNLKANLLKTLGRTSEAVEIYLDIILKGEELQLPFVRIFINNLAYIYLDLKEYEKALEYFSYALEKEKQLGNFQGVARAYSNLGKTHWEMIQDSTAKQYLVKTMKMVEKYEFTCFSGYLSILGFYHAKYDNQDSARYYLEKALEISVSCENQGAILDSKLNLAEMLLEEKGLKESESFFLDVFNTASEANSPSEILRASKGLYEINKIKGNDTKALKYHEIFHAQKDSIYNKESTAKIARLEANFAFEKKKRQIVTEQEQKSLILENEIQNRTTILYLSLIAIFIFCVLSFFLYRLYLRKKQANVRISNQNKQITETAKQLEEANTKLAELSRFKDGLTDMIAHDMKNALNTILGYAASDPHNKKMHNISRAGSLMMNLVTNMLDVQRFHEAEVPLNYQIESIEKIMKEARDQVELLLQMKSISCNFSIADTANIKVDSDILTRVIVNLLTNAIKYSNVGGSIWINSKIQPVESGKLLIVTVKDEGTGISDDMLSHIFDRFSQADARKSGKAASTGLGLTFCKLAIEAHGGVISVASVPNEGSTFIINIPLPEIFGEDESNCETGYAEIPVHSLPWVGAKDRPKLEQLIPVLNELEIYEVGELNKIFEDLESQGVNSRWVVELKAAVQYADEEKYVELIRNFEEHLSS